MLRDTPWVDGYVPTVPPYVDMAIIVLAVILGVLFFFVFLPGLYISIIVVIGIFIYHKIRKRSKLSQIKNE